jgi:hypothetical protein
MLDLPQRQQVRNPRLAATEQPVKPGAGQNDQRVKTKLAIDGHQETDFLDRRREAVEQLVA